VHHSKFKLQYSTFAALVKKQPILNVTQIVTFFLPLIYSGKIIVESQRYSARYPTFTQKTNTI
jgi:hypothetical protein